MENTQQLSEYTVTAYNYAERSANKMHSAEVAAEYGYSGGLVPGVALYAYMTAPAVELWGRDWLNHGSMSGKFIHAVYDGEVVCVRPEHPNGDVSALKLQLFNRDGALCAVGEATLHHDQPPADVADFPIHPLPSSKHPATIAALSEGTALGSVAFTFEGRDTPGEFQRFLEEVRAEQSIYEADELLHPAYIAAKGNRILMENVDLGPWIHTATRVWHHDVPNTGDHMTIRGAVEQAYEKRGHEIVELNLALFGDDDRCYASLVHTAIVKPKRAAG